MHQLIENIITKAKANSKTIILAEGNDPRIIQAAAVIDREKIAKVILLGNDQEITGIANNQQQNISNINIIDPSNYSGSELLAQKLFESRKHKGLTIDEAKKQIKSPIYFGTMLVYQGYADGMVAGSNCPTADVLKPALQIIKAVPDQSIVSTFFIIIEPNNQFGDDGVMFFSDCSLNLNPNADQLADIAIQTANSYKFFVEKVPKVAMLSFSTNGSAYGEMVAKVQQATDIARSKAKGLLIEGEIQADAALVPEVSQHKSPNSQIKGQANILVFPDLNSGNIGYKLVQRLANAKAFGPVTQGLNKPINDLSRGCNIEDIIITTAITSIQASTPVCSPNYTQENSYSYPNKS